AAKRGPSGASNSTSGRIGREIVRRVLIFSLRVLCGSMAEVRARRVVAAMDRGVAVETGTVEDPVARPRAVAQGGGVVERAGVPGVGVALLAEERNRGLLQLQVVRSVRRMTVQAVLADRRMLPKERAALFGVAAVALLVDRGRFDHLRGLGAVRVVAIDAGDLSFADRMVRGLPGVGAHVLVAGEALLGHRLLLELGMLRLWRVDAVAGDARQAARLVAAVVPEELFAARVAALADGRSLGGGKVFEPGVEGGIVRRFGVGVARPVAGLAAERGELAESRAAVRGVGQVIGLIAVAADARFAAGVAGGTRACRGGRRPRSLGGVSRDQVEAESSGGAAEP